jgi:LmbE family N-acetylglucosaminyl deacetylase
VSTSSNRRRALVVTAHPDDETLWFSSVFARYDTDVVCVTCGWDAHTRQRRRQELEAAAARQGVHGLYVLDHADDPRRVKGTRLDVARLGDELQQFAEHQYDAVFTHSPYGEVNHHPHHQDVSFAVHQVFDRVLSVAWNQYPTVTHDLTAAEYALKQQVMGTIYWQEYAALATTYEISAQERFAEVSRDASEILYWGVVNFGDRHETLGARYPDMWGFATSPYENERHETIERIAASTNPTRILEVGAAEGHLSRRLGRIAPIECVEPAKTYAARLAAQGLSVVPPGEARNCDLIVLAAVLEYMRDPVSYLQTLRAPRILTDTNPRFPFNRVSEGLTQNYTLVRREFIPPRWEPMRHGNTTETLAVYKIGAEIALWCER